MVRTDKDWPTFLRCIFLYIPAWLLLLVALLGLLAVGLGFLLLYGLSILLWRPLQKRARSLLSGPKIKRTNSLVSEVITVVERVKSGDETFTSALSTLSIHQTEKAWPAAARLLVTRATEELNAERFTEAFALARFGIELSDHLLNAEERFECRRILVLAQLPPGFLAEAQPQVVRETGNRDRQADPAIWTRTLWWMADLGMEKRPKDMAAVAQAIGAYTKAYKGLQGPSCAYLRGEALKRLAGLWWNCRQTLGRDRRICEEKAICCMRRALTILDSNKDTLDAAIIRRELGVYYYYRQSGERRSNLEESIYYLRDAAEMLRLDGRQFALIQHWLGAVFFYRIRGDRARNLERAIHHFQQTRHVNLSERVKKRTQELLDHAIKELWGPAAEVVVADSVSRSPYGAAAVAPFDLRSKLPTDIELGNSPMPQRPPWWRWAAKLQGLTLIISLILAFFYFRHPVVWLSVLTLGTAISMSMLSWKNPQAMENQFFLVFLFTPRFFLELIRLWFTYKEKLFEIILSARSYSANPQSALQAFRKALAALDEKRFPLLRLALSQGYGSFLVDNPVGEEGESYEEALLHLQSYRSQEQHRSLAVFETVNSELLAKAYLRRRRGDPSENARVAKDLLVNVMARAELRSGSKNWHKRKDALFLLGEAHRGEACGEIDADLRRRSFEQAVLSYRAALSCQPSRLRQWRESRKTNRQLKESESILTDASICFGLAQTLSELALVGDSSSAVKIRSYLEVAQAYVARAASVFTERTEFPSVAITRKAIEIDLLLARLLKENCDAEALYRRAAYRAMQEGLSGLVLEALSGLGKLFYHDGRHKEAIDALAALIDYQDRIRWQVLSIERRAELLRNNIEDFDRLISSLVRMGRIEDAIALSERSRSRTLVDLLHIRGVLPGKVDIQPMQGFWSHILQVTLLEHQLGSGDPLAKPLGRERGPGDKLYELMRDRDADDSIQDADLSPLLPAQPMSAAAIKALAKRSHSILLLFRITAERSFAFLVFPDGELEVVETELFRGADLDRMVRIIEDETEVGDSWIALEKALDELSERLLLPIRDRLAQWKAQPGHALSRLVIVPNRGLAVLPLHACSWQNGGERKYLIDEFVVSYAPNLSLLASCLDREVDRAKDFSLFAIGNPYPNTAADELPLAEWECERIKSLVGPEHSLVRVREAATQEEVLKQSTVYTCMHFACHATYITNDAFNSRILLANNKGITFAEILEQITLPQSRLITLSACETGRLDSREVADESLSLATGFLIAGAPTVWCTLWKIFDVPSALLMSKAYQILFSTGGVGKCEALRDAQLWLRDVTDSELAADSELTSILNFLESQGEDFGRRLRKSLEEGKTPGYRRFSHPKAWAAYQSLGA